MITFAQFFGCDTNSILQRSIEDDQPLAVSWMYDPEPTSMLAEVAFDNTTFIEAVGDIIKLSNNVWQLKFHPQDRPTNPGLITYRFTDNLGNTETLQVEIVGQPVFDPIQTLDPIYSKYGPKRVKTKQMEIEQFDPRVLQDLEDRLARNSIPTFSNSMFAVGRNQEEC